jgi:hypothetical protein
MSFALAFDHLVRSESSCQSHIRNIAAVSSTSIVETERPRAETNDLQQTTRDHDILHEVNHLIHVGKVGVESETGDYRKDCKRNRSDASHETPATLLLVPVSVRRPAKGAVTSIKIGSSPASEKERYFDISYRSDR